VSPEIAGASERAIRDALERNLWALWSRFGRGEECVLHEHEDALFFDTPIPTLPYNAVLHFCAVSDLERRIDAIFEHYRQRDVPFIWIVHPTAQPSDLGERLRARGLEEAEVCPGMAMDLSEVAEPAEPPTRIEIHEAATSDTEDVLELVAWRWEVPKEVLPKLPGIARAFEVGVPGSPVRCWVARQDGLPVSKVILNLAAGAAGIYGVVTKPEARGLGLARILTLQALQAARDAGYNLGVLHSSPMAVRLYERVGFRAIAPFRIFAPPRAFHV
jgi:GNAT superfamily N-acetyltransferase